MIRSIWFFIKLGIAVFALSWILNSRGQIAIDIDHWRIETSAAIGLVAVICMVFIATGLLRIGDWIKHWPVYWQRRREKIGIRALTKGFVAIASGDADLAMKEAKRAERNLPNTPLRNLLLAQAEQLRGNRQGAAKYFVALMQDEETSFLGLRGLLNQAIGDGKYDQALSLARKAHAEQPNSAAIWRNLFMLEARAHHWPNAETILKKIARGKALPRSTSDEYAAAIAVEMARLEEKNGNLRLAARLYKRALTSSPELIAAATGYVESLFKQNRRFLAERALQRAFAKHPHPDLVNLALIYFTHSDGKMLKTLRRLAATHPDDASIHRAMTEYAIHRHLWGMAISHARDMMRILPSQSHYRVLQRLVACLPANDGIMTMEGRKLQNEFSDPSILRNDPMWTCRACHRTANLWRANCPHCGEFQTMQWGDAERFAPVKISSPFDA